jgi:hypothetical protein
MLRKTIYCILALLMCALIVVGIDCARRSIAIGRLDQKRVEFVDWNYRITRGVAPDPLKADYQIQGWLRRMIEFPRAAVRRRMVANPEMARDLVAVQMQELFVMDCPDFSPRVVAELCGRTSIRRMVVENSGFTDESLNLLWTGLPELDEVILTRAQVGVNGFRDIGKARKLKHLYLHLENIDNPMIARIGAAPALERLIYGLAELPEDAAPAIAAMPALSEVFLQESDANTRLAAKLRELNPGISVTFLGVLPVTQDVPPTAPSPAP